jgi:hypothetical protein
MSEAAVWVSGGALVMGIVWLGVDVSGPLMRALVRPAVLAGLATLLLIVNGGIPMRWPYMLIALAAALGVWESYAGAYGTLGMEGVRRSPRQQVQVCAAWLVGVIANLTLLNMAFQRLDPATFHAKGEPAGLLDVAYLTLLTFASGGYGDVMPQTVAGKVLSMVTSLGGLLYATILFTALFQALREE